MKTAVLPEKNYPAEMAQVEEKLDALRSTGTFARKTGETIYYELYRVPEAKGWIAISHGFTENTVKYAEVIWYFVQEGYSVAICDHRGHGRSFRSVEENWLTHVDKFDDYSDDYAYFIREVIAPELNGLPLFLMGHSMGGAIAAHVAERFPELPLKKLILCSPMIAPQTAGVPKWMTVGITQFYILTGRGKTKLFNQSIFDGVEDFLRDSCATSEARYRWFLSVQKRSPLYQNSAATYYWLKESVLQTKRLLKKENAAKIKMPVLLLQAGLDVMVENSKQDELIAKVPNGRKVVFPKAKHEIFRSDDETVEKFMNTILNFIEE